MIVTFLGHRDFIKEGGSEATLLSVLEERVGDTPVEFYLGGYGAFDAFAAGCCEKYRQKHRGSTLVFVTPYMTPEYLDRRSDRYDTIVYPEIEKAPPKFAISYRNRWMVDQADLVIAYVRYDWGGAYQSYRYAKRKGKVIYNLAK